MKYASVHHYLQHVGDRNPGQPELLQAVTEVMESLWQCTFAMAGDAVCQLDSYPVKVSTCTKMVQ